MEAKRAKFQELNNIIMSAPITPEAKDQFGDVLDSAVELMDNFHEGVQLLSSDIVQDYERRRIETLYIRAIWRGRLIEAVESFGATPEHLDVFTRLLGGMRQLESLYPELYLPKATDD